MNKYWFAGGVKSKGSSSTGFEYGGKLDYANQVYACSQSDSFLMTF